MEGKPSWAEGAKDGVYVVDTESSTNTLYSNGLDFTNDLERFSLGNWNSIVKNDKIFTAPQGGISSLMGLGRPVRLQWTPPYLYGYVAQYNTEGEITSFSNTVTTGNFISLSAINYDEEPGYDQETNDWSNWRDAIIAVDKVMTEVASDLFPTVTDTNYYGNMNFFNADLMITWGDGFGFIQEREDENSPIIIVPDSTIIEQMNAIRSFTRSITFTDLYTEMYYKLIPLQGTHPDFITTPFPSWTLGLDIKTPSGDAEASGQSATYNFNANRFEITDVSNTDVGEAFGAPSFTTNINVTSTNVPDEVNFKAICFGGIASEYSKDLGAQSGLKNDPSATETTGISTLADADPYQWHSAHDGSSGVVLAYIEDVELMPNYWGDKITLYSNTDGTARFWIKIPNDDLVDGNTYKVTGFGHTEDDIDPHLIIGAPYFAAGEFILGDSPASVLGDFEINFTTDFEKFPDEHYLFFYIPSTNLGQQPGASFTLENVNISATDEFTLRDSVSAVNNRALLYYDEENNMYNQNSYPLKVYLGLDILGVDNFTNQEDELTEEGKWAVSDLFYVSDENTLATMVEDLLPSATSLVQNNVFYYEVIQWGDEDVLLSDDDILDSEYFSTYDFEGSPSPTDFKFKRFNQSQATYSKPIINDDDRINLVSHIYDTPGVKSIKIIVYRYKKDLSLLIETILVTKNINIGDGGSLAQDFEIFGGTDFNFLPLSGNRYAVVGGLDSDSKYSNSTNKIAKDELYTEDDFLERKTVIRIVEEFIEDRYGKAPGQVDLSTTRVFKGAQDIYNFLMTDEQKTQFVNSEFPNFSDDFFGEDNKVKTDSEATDIFINDNEDSTIKEECILELNPQNTEYLTIHNTVGVGGKGILIGDYKIGKRKNQPLQKEGMMEAPLLEEDSQKQAF